MLAGMRFSRVLHVSSMLVCLAMQASGQPADPAVVLVSLDGFRHDYAQLYDAPRLRALGEAGAVAKGLVPVFPSMTFSSHYSIATGLYSENHGIVDNVFHDAATGRDYMMSTQGREDGWVRGIPLWTLAERNGVRAAVLGWPGSEAPVNGVRSTHVRDYASTAKATADEKVQQVLTWLKLPASQRPRFVALYLDNTDSAAHKFGFDGAELRTAVHQVDAAIGKLWEGLQELGTPVNVIIVSDHGMIKNQGVVLLRDFTDLRHVKVVQGGGAIVHLYPPDREVREQVYADLHGRDGRFEIYRREETPRRWRYAKDARIGDLVVVAKKPVVLNGRAAELPGLRPFPNNIGGHGFDAGVFPEMNGIFYAAGPNVRAGRKLAAFESIHVYPLVARMLGLPVPAGVDGKAAVLGGIYVGRKAKR